MNQNTMRRFVYTIFLGVLIVSCAVVRTELKKTWVDENRRGKPVSDILVIGLTDEAGLRQSFEKKFVAALKAAGVEAVSSTEAIPIPQDMQLEKNVILKAIEQYGNDAVIITHLVGVEEKKVDSPKRFVPQDFTGYYNDAYADAHQRGRRSTFTVVRLETNLYDAKTEKPIWSGQSNTWNPVSDSNMLDEVITLVIDDLGKKELMPAK
jgi:hypothetical protein